MMVNFINVFKTLARHPVKSFTTGAKYVVSYKPPANVHTGVVPFSPAGGAVAVAKGGSRVISGVKKFGQYVGIGQPQTIKQVAKNLFRFGGAYAAGSYAATGHLPKPSLRTLAGYAGAQVNLPATIFGGIHGLSTEGIAKAKDIFTKAKTEVPYTMSPEYFKQLAGMYKTDISNAMPNIPSSFNFMTPSAPSFSTGGLVLPSPSLNVQSPSSDFTPLLLALLGLGGGAYLLHRLRKKRKKKKYKKRRRY